jgi:hypothetical protein
MFRKWYVGYGLDGADSEQGQVAGTCECGNEPSGFHKMRRISLLPENLLASQGFCSVV